MDFPPEKILAARAATSAAVDVIRDGARFAIVAGTNTAWPVYPTDGSMAVADARTRAEAKQAVAGLRSNGGTAIGQWLRLTHRIFQSYPATLRHAILLTDGKNQHETPEELAAAIGLCEGSFRCDCRGVGTDWVVDELRKISTALLGTVDIVPDPAGLAADFEEMMRGAMSKQLPDVMLRVWTPQTAIAKFVKQVAPAIEDLTGRRSQTSPQVGEYPTGAWAPGESRDYHVGVQVNVGSSGPGDARRPGQPGGQLAVGPADPRPGPDPGDVDRGRGAVHADQPGGRALHRAGGTGRGHPGWA